MPSLILGQIKVIQSLATKEPRHCAVTYSFLPICIL